MLFCEAPPLPISKASPNQYDKDNSCVTEKQRLPTKKAAHCCAARLAFRLGMPVLLPRGLATRATAGATIPRLAQLSKKPKRYRSAFAETFFAWLSNSRS